MRLLTVCQILLLTLVASCAESVAPASDAADPPRFAETVVMLTPAGAQVVASRPLSPEQAQVDNAARAERLARPDAPLTIAPDATCNGAALWLYDRADGTGNRLCFLGSGVADLRTFWRWADGYWQTWSIGVGSVWPGVSPGRLTATNYAGGEIDAGANDPRPYQQVFAFTAWSSRQPFYGLIPYVRVELD